MNQKGKVWSCNLMVSQNIPNCTLVLLSPRSLSKIFQISRLFQGVKRYCVRWLRNRMFGWNIISEPSSEIRKTRFTLISHWREQRKIRCLERDLNSHLRVSRLSSQLKLVGCLTQFKSTKYFCDDLTLVFEDVQCFNSISEQLAQ